MRPTLSLVLSFRNEEVVLPALLERLEHILGKMGTSYELVFVNDASTDNSLEFLKGKALLDSRVKIINMSRRFGVPACLIAGMRYAQGDAVISMDTDLQDPPEVIPELVEKWKQGADIVYTIRKSRAGESSFKQNLTRLAYQMLRLASLKTDLPLESGDFRLLSKKACQELLKIEDKEPYLRGLVHTLNFPKAPVYYDREKRYLGESHFPVFSKGPVQTFLSGLLSFSTLPLYFSAAISIGTGILFLFLPSLNIVTLFFLALLQFFAFGIMGLYAARIYRQRQNRPLFIVESTVNFETPELAKDNLSYDASS